jgi:hypothetical protein
MAEPELIRPVVFVFISELGQKRKCPGSRGTSVLPSGADIVSLPRHVRLVPKAEILSVLQRSFRGGIALNKINLNR